MSDNVLNKSEFVKRLSQKMPNIQKKAVRQVVDNILDYMIFCIKKGYRIELRGFGSFNHSTLPAKVGRNPKTGESVNLPERKRILFKSSKHIRHGLNKKKA